MSYKVVEAMEPEQLVVKVEEAEREQWRVQGGVSVTACGDDSYLYVQAMVRGSFGVPATSTPAERRKRR